MKQLHLFIVKQWLPHSVHRTNKLKRRVILEKIYINTVGVTTPSLRCRICGRVLKNEESIKTGVGPTCLEKTFGIIYSLKNINTVNTNLKQNKLFTKPL